jgi:hypothetical protein
MATSKQSSDGAGEKKSGDEIPKKVDKNSAGTLAQVRD